MPHVAIVSDTTCDIPPHLARELGVETAPLAVVTDGVENVAELDMDTHALYRTMAADAIDEAEIRVVDTRSAVFAQGALVLEAARRARDGATLEELAAWCEAAAPRARSYFATPSLRILQAIGRVDHLGPATGTSDAGSPVPKYALVRIADGRFIPFDTAADDEEASAKLVAAAREDGFAGGAGAATGPGDATGGTSATPLRAFFCHCGNAALAGRLEEAVHAAFPVAGSDRRDDGAITAVLMGGTGGAGFGLLPVDEPPRASARPEVATGRP